MIGGYWLAHAAGHEGIIAVEHMAGENPMPLDQNLVPRVTFCRPEVASFGLTKAEAEEEGYEVKESNFPFRAIGKALIEGEPNGFFKVVADAETDLILGMHAIGPHVTDLISEGVFRQAGPGNTAGDRHVPSTRTRRSRRSSARPQWPSTDKRSISRASTTRSFDPARDGLGFRNRAGMLRPSGSQPSRRLERFLYGRGLCFGMVATALTGYKRDNGDLAELSPDAGLLAAIRRYHVRQYGWRSVLTTVWNWLCARGGRPEYTLEHLRMPDESPDPHILCFGPALNRRFFGCLARAHAVAPYRTEDRAGERRVYVLRPQLPEEP